LLKLAVKLPQEDVIGAVKDAIGPFDTLTVMVVSSEQFALFAVSTTE
jgi:hypothetical protein